MGPAPSRAARARAPRTRAEASARSSAAAIRWIAVRVSAVMGSPYAGVFPVVLIPATNTGATGSGRVSHAVPPLGGGVTAWFRRAGTLTRCPRRRWRMPRPCGGGLPFPAEGGTGVA